MKEFKVFLREDEIPKQWYNIQADLPTPFNRLSTLGQDNQSGLKTLPLSSP